MNQYRIFTVELYQTKNKIEGLALNDMDLRKKLFSYGSPCHMYHEMGGLLEKIEKGTGRKRRTFRCMSQS